MISGLVLTVMELPLGLQKSMVFILSGPDYNQGLQSVFLMDPRSGKFLNFRPS
jgi:hypothetical protein